MDQRPDNQEATLPQEAPADQAQLAVAGDDHSPAPLAEPTASSAAPSNRQVHEATSPLDEAAASLKAGRWGQARRALDALFGDAAGLPEAQRERLGEICLGVAASAGADGDWRVAADLLERLLALDIAAETATARLGLVRQRQTGQAHLAQAQAAFVAARWQECLEEAEAAVAGLPTSMVARELRHSAIEELEKEEHRRQVVLQKEERRRRRAELDQSVRTALLEFGTKSVSLAEQGVQLARKSLLDLRPSLPTLPNVTHAEPGPEPEGQLVPRPAYVPPTQVKPSPAKPAPQPAVGELPPGWELAEEPGEDTATGSGDLGATFGLGGAGNATVALARHYIAGNPASDDAYCWLGRHYLLRGQFDEGREVLGKGLVNCSRRRRLCQTYGWLELETGRLDEAVGWWLRSAHLQLAVHRLDTREPFLYLAYLATFYGLAARADQLFALVDSIQHLRLSGSGEEELQTLAAAANKKRIVAGIGSLGRRLDEAQPRT